MKKLVIANWKMNPQTVDEARHLVSSFEHRMSSVAGHVDVVVCPPFVYMPPMMHYVHLVHLGAQNMSWQESGALTGEISASQLKQWNIQYIILGHSERRMYLGETDSIVNQKIITALEHK